jgi:hypothetical protein
MIEIGIALCVAYTVFRVSYVFLCSIFLPKESKA